jgi:flagellar biogenesis protein FliO
MNETVKEIVNNANTFQPEQMIVVVGVVLVIGLVVFGIWTLYQMMS